MPTRRDDGLPAPKWEGGRRAKALARVRRLGQAKNLPCCLCGQPIDYGLRYPDPMSCSVEHVKPRSLNPESTWDPSLMQPAHLVCNQRKGNGRRTTPRRAEPDDWLGVTSGW